jgi:hypothetical protein
MRASIGATAINSKRYAVITADVVNSRKIRSFRLKRDSRLKELSRLHMEQKLILSPYTITVWDEFQVILSKPEFTPRVILDLRRLFFPLQLWIAVGLGSASGTHSKPINIHAGGEAFERARQAADLLKSGSTKYRVLTCFKSGDESLDTIANTIYHLQDSLIERTTEKQWAAINIQLETGRQDLTAKRLKLNISTISRNLKRGNFWHLVETVDSMERILKAYL